MKLHEMSDSIETFYIKNEHLMQIAKVSRPSYFSWLDSFTTHESMRKAHRFIFGGTGSDIGTKTSLARKTAIAAKVYEAFPKDSWAILFTTSPSQFNVRNLKAACKDMSKVWIRRTKRKSGME